MKREIVNTLMEAIRQEDYDEVKSIIDAHPESVSAVDGFGVAAFFHATKSHNMAIIQLFLDGGVNVNDPGNTRNTERLTPMHAAAESENVEILKQLIRYGGDVHVVTHSAHIERGIFYYALYGTNKEIIHLLLNLGINVNATDEQGRGYLKQALVWGRLESVPLLLEQGLDTKRIEEAVEYLKAVHAPKIDRYNVILKDLEARLLAQSEKELLSEAVMSETGSLVKEGSKEPELSAQKSMPWRL